MKKHTGEKTFIEEVGIEPEEINKDLNEIISEEKRIINKSSKLDSNRFGKFIKQMKLAINLVKDFRNKTYTDVPWRSIAMIAAAFLYFINPMDIVPDILPVFGYSDDAILFAAVFKSIQSDLETYGRWKGIDTRDYF